MAKKESKSLFLQFNRNSLDDDYQVGMAILDKVSSLQREPLYISTTIQPTDRFCAKGIIISSQQGRQRTRRIINLSPQEHSHHSSSTTHICWQGTHLDKPTGRCGLHD